MDKHRQPSMRRRIRSFVLRQGRLTEGQARALQNLWPRYGLVIADCTEQSATQQFQQAAPTILEIGFGNGDSLLAMAEQQPEKNFIGVEVHRPGVGALLNNAGNKDTRNLRVFCDDAVDVLNQAIADESLAGLQLFFPDPWHKKRHHKRRIVQPDFVELVVKKLIPGGYFHLATDWENYAEQMMDLVSQHPELVNQAGDSCFSPRPDYRPETKFERRGINLGHAVWDLIFSKAHH